MENDNMNEQVDYSGTYKYNGNQEKLTEIVEIIRQASKCGLLNNSEKKSKTNVYNEVVYNYIYNFSDENRDFKVDVDIPKKLYDINDLNMYYLEKYVNQIKKK